MLPGPEGGFGSIGEIGADDNAAAVDNGEGTDCETDPESNDRRASLVLMNELAIKHGSDRTLVGGTRSFG